VSTDSAAGHGCGSWALALALRQLLRQADFIERAFEAGTFGRAAHDAGVHDNLRVEVKFLPSME